MYAETKRTGAALIRAEENGEATEKASATC